MTPIIRAATQADLSGILDVERAAGRDGDASVWLSAALEDPQRTVRVAVDAGQVVAWAKTHHYPDAEGPAPAGHYLGGVTVHPDRRRCGLATALTTARCVWVAERADAVHCIISATNEASLALHLGLDFTEIARAERLHGTVFDAGVGVVLSRTLP